MSTSARVFIGSLLVLAFVMALFALMNHLKFEGMLSGLIQGRLQTSALGVADALRSATKEGTPLPRVAKVAALLAQARRADPEIGQIDVFDAAGRRLYSSASDLTAADRVDPALLAAQRASSGQTWKLETLDSFVGGARILDRQGRPQGGVAVSQPLTDFQRQQSAFADNLLKRTTVVFVGGALLIFLGVRLASRELRRLLASLGAAHARIALGEQGQPAPAPEAPGELAATAEAIVQQYAAASEGIARYERGMSAFSSKRGSAALPEEQLAAVRLRSGARSIEDLRGAVGAFVEELLAQEEEQEPPKGDRGQNGGAP